MLLDNAITERDYTNIFGRTKDEVPFKELWDMDSNISYEGCETGMDFHKRVYGFIKKIKEYPYECILVSAHAGVFRVFELFFSYSDKKQNLHDYVPKNCSYKIYDVPFA
jgi:broad specificity phosphatase PhoE